MGWCCTVRNVLERNRTQIRWRCRWYWNKKNSKIQFLLKRASISLRIVYFEKTTKIWKIFQLALLLLSNVNLVAFWQYMNCNTRGGNSLYSHKYPSAKKNMIVREVLLKLNPIQFSHPVNNPLKTPWINSVPTKRQCNTMNPVLHCDFKGFFSESAMFFSNLQSPK